MKYRAENGVLFCECKSGYTFLADVEDYEKLSKYNWFSRGGRIEGNAGGKGERVMLGRVIMGVGDKGRFVRQKQRGNDFRKSNLYIDNSYEKDGDGYLVITHGKSFRIDADDLEVVKRFHWRKNTHGYAEALVDGRPVQMHRVIMGVGNFVSFDEVVDHINGDRSDNRKENLRVVTQCENAGNRNDNKPPVNEVYGVYYDKHINRWRGRYSRLGERYEITLCDSMEEACKEMLRLKSCVESGVPYERKTKRKSNSGEKYVYFQRGRYIVSINGEYLGSYKTLEEGISVRDAHLQ